MEVYKSINISSQSFISELKDLKNLSILEHILGIILIFIFVLVLSQIVFRFFGNSLIWSEELSRYLFIWLAFLGGSLATMQGSHIVIGANITTRFTKKTQDWIVFLVSFLTVIVIIVLAIEGLKQSIATMSYEAVSMPIPMGLVWSVIPISAFIMLIYIFRDLIKQFKAVSQKDA